MEGVRPMSQAQVRDYMTPDPQTLDAQSTLLDAVLMMRRSELRHIPILEDGRVVGILSDRDVARFAPSILVTHTAQDYNRVFEETPIAKVMSRKLVHTTPDAKLAEAVHVIYSQKLGCLPVLESDRLVGIITVTDMLRALHELMGNLGDGRQT
jgi:acetoin utilization protein AcuB